MVRVMLAMMVTLSATAMADEWITIQGKDLSTWRGDTGTWTMASDHITLKGDEGKLLGFEPGVVAAVNGEDGRTVNLISKHEHADVEAHIEFMVPNGSNSGVYFMGRYEIQVLDSWGEANPEYADCGGIYEQNYKPGEAKDPDHPSGHGGRPPRVNAALRPGEWQTYDVKFRAPRFDANGNKTENAKFIEVRHNGVIIHENEEVTGPTRAGIATDEKPTGPLMLQGDHGPVAYRNIRLRPIGE